MPAIIADDLVKEHEAARFTIRLLDDSMENIEHQPNKENGSREQPAMALRSRTRTLRWALVYFSDGLRNQLERDEALILPAVIDEVKKIMESQHETICLELEQAIYLANCLADGVRTGEDAVCCGRELRQAVRRIRKLVEEHTRQQDRVLVGSSKT